MNEFRKGINQAEVNDIGVGYLGITGLGISWFASSVFDGFAFGVITFFVLIILIQTRIGTFIINSYAVGWAILVFTLNQQNQGYVLAGVLALIAGFIAWNLGQQGREFYDDVNY